MEKSTALVVIPPSVPDLSDVDLEIVEAIPELRTGTVGKLGLLAWQGKSGPILLDDGEFVVIRLIDRDDAGESVYDVRMPRASVVFNDT